MWTFGIFEPFKYWIYLNLWPSLDTSSDNLSNYPRFEIFNRFQRLYLIFNIQYLIFDTISIFCFLFVVFYFLSFLRRDWVQLEVNISWKTSVVSIKFKSHQYWGHLNTLEQIFLAHFKRVSERNQGQEIRDRRQAAGKRWLK